MTAALDLLICLLRAGHNWTFVGMPITGQFWTPDRAIPVYGTQYFCPKCGAVKTYRSRWL